MAFNMTNSQILEKYKGNFKESDWDFEISSGYDGWRNKINNDWVDIDMVKRLQKQESLFAFSKGIKKLEIAGDLKRDIHFAGSSYPLLMGSDYEIGKPKMNGILVATCDAVNNTVGAGINPLAVPDMKKALQAAAILANQVAFTAAIADGATKEEAEKAASNDPVFRQIDDALLAASTGYEPLKDF